jgi:peroxiredoxin
LVREGSFNFKIASNKANLYRLSIEKNGGVLSTLLFLEPKKCELIIEDSALKTVTVKGNRADLDFQTFSKNLVESNAQIDFRESLNRAIETHTTSDSMVRSRLDSLLALRISAWEKIASTWIKEHKNSEINSYVAYKFLFGTSYEDELKGIFSNLILPDKYNCWDKELFYCLSNLSVGCFAPDFSQLDTSANKVSLSKFRGQYVLLDFWASWCLPCRKEIPILKTAYPGFNAKGFEIISISLDDKKEDWMAAIKKDQTEWTQVSDLKGWENVISKQYFVSAIPMNYLIDRNGRIIAKDVHGETLLKTLTDLMN